MTGPTAADEKGEAKSGRGPKPFPVDSFSDSLALAQGIQTHAAGNSMRRTTLFDKLGTKPESGRSRQLIANSNKYGLTTGSAASDFITITDEAAKYLDAVTSPREKLRLGFDLAIVRSDIFNKLYERLKDKRVPAPDVLRDELEHVGVSADQRDQAARVFLDNVRHLGLIRELSGNERLISIEHALEDGMADSPPEAAQPTAPVAAPTAPSAGQSSTRAAMNSSEPAVHIDIQIHIDATASPEQIDQIFASMAKHLYGRESAE